jgi:hypothetical protein
VRGLVAIQTSQLSGLDVEEGLVALRVRHLEPGGGFGERGLNLIRSLEAASLAEGMARLSRPENFQTRVPNRRLTAIASSASVKRSCAIIEIEMRRGHHG